LNTRASRNRAPRTATAGLTLIELMAVVTLLSFIIGIGLGMFAGLDPGRQVAASLVQNTLRSAHNSAIARSSSARVRIDAAAGTLSAEQISVIGTWHFEAEPVVGAFQLDGAAHGMDRGYISDDGYQGRALAMHGQPEGARVEIPVHTDPAYDFGAGFALNFALRLEGDRAAKLLDVGRVLLVGVRRQGVLEVAFMHEVEDDPMARGESIGEGIGESIGEGVGRSGGKIVLRTPPGTLRPGRWARIRVAYDRARFTVAVDGVEVASMDESAPVWRVEHALVIGGGQTAFPGSLDSLVVSAVKVGDAVVLPEGVRLASGTPSEVLFASGGALDPRRHAAPVDVVLEFADGQRQTIKVNLYGTVE
jgi:hypothetical protein